MTTRGRVPLVIAGEPKKWSAGSWIQTFVVFQFACQLALLSDFFNPLRIYVRSAAFGFSLALLIFLPRGRNRPHPSAHAAGWILLVLALSLFHPTTSSLAAGIGQIALYLAILGPLFWVPQLKLDAADLRRVLLIIFIFHTLSAGVGVLQTYYPGRFQPSLSSSIADQDKGYVESLKVTLANGQRVFRPMGLTDVPGGSATAGFYAVLFGIGFYLTTRRRGARFACLLSIMVGFVCIYLSQIRSMMVLTAVCLLAFCSLFAWQKRRDSLISFAGVLAASIALSFTFAVAIGGSSVTTRMSTLIEERPDIVYYKNRGLFLDYTLNELLPKYPFGAGLGRWGIMNNFGDNADPNRAGIYVEIQWTGWLLDGGIPLILTYVAALLIALRKAMKITLTRGIGDLSIWGAIVLAYSVGAVAGTFNYPVFIGQSGMEFWLLNAALFAAARKFLPHKNSYQRAGA
jgi:hypothetical protein